MSRGCCATTLVTVCLLAAPLWASPLTPSTDDVVAREALGARLLGAKLLWVRDGTIWFSALEPWDPQAFAAGGLEETRPRWSPDGNKILFSRQLTGVLIMDADFGNEEVILSGAHTADWADNGQAVTAIADNGYGVIKYELAGGTDAVIFDSRVAPFNGEPIEQAAELHPSGRYLLTFRVTPEHVTEIVDLQEERYISNAQMERGDCSPAWSPDGTALLNTARTGSRPVLRAGFDAGAGSVTDSALFASIADICDCNSFYIHGQRYSNDGQWLTFGGWIKDGPKANGHREIYVWKIGEPHAAAVRLTFDTSEDKGPSLWVPVDACPGGGSSEICDDGLDNDCDGLTDAGDSIDCPAPPAPDGGPIGAGDTDTPSGGDAGAPSGDEGGSEAGTDGAATASDDLSLVGSIGCAATPTAAGMMLAAMLLWRRRRRG